MPTVVRRTLPVDGALRRRQGQSGEGGGQLVVHPEQQDAEPSEVQGKQRT